MSQLEPGTSQPKKAKLSVDDGQNEVVAAFVDDGVAAPIEDDQEADILKLNFDCFAEIFEHLSLRDVIAMGKTCKRLNQVAGYIIQQVYSGGDINITKAVYLTYKNTRIDEFVQFVRKLKIKKNVNFEHFLKLETKLPLLRKVDLISIDIDAAKMPDEMLAKLETLYVNRCTVEGDFNETVLLRCQSLERLRVIAYVDNSIIIGTNNDWLCREYPLLRYFGLVLLRVKNGEHATFPQINFFLEKNPNIRSILLSSNVLWAQKESILESTAKLDDLAIFFDRNETTSFDSIVNLLNKLHEKGFYKRLELASSQSTNNLTVNYSALHALEKLEIKFDKYNGQSVSVECPLHCLKQLFVDGSDRVADVQQFASNLPRLEQVEFARIFITHLINIVGQAACLRRIICRWIQYRVFEREYIENYFLNLRQLNELRKKLAGAKKVTVYVPELVFSQTRETQKKTDFEMIRMMRYESFEAENILALNFSSLIL